jgi:hypothetical protein
MASRALAHVAKRAIRQRKNTAASAAETIIRPFAAIAASDLAPVLGQDTNSVFLKWSSPETQNFAHRGILAQDECKVREREMLTFFLNKVDFDNDDDERGRRARLLSSLPPPVRFREAEKRRRARWKFGSGNFFFLSLSFNPIDRLFFLSFVVAETFLSPSLDESFQRASLTRDLFSFLNAGYDFAVWFARRHGSDAV